MWKKLGLALETAYAENPEKLNKIKAVFRKQHPRFEEAVKKLKKLVDSQEALRMTKLQEWEEKVKNLKVPMMPEEIVTQEDDWEKEREQFNKKIKEENQVTFERELHEAMFGDE